MKKTEPRDAADSIGDITHILKTISTDMMRLLLVEARLFGHTALTMIVLSLVIAVLLVGGWLFTAVALVVALSSLQVFSLMSALLTVALAHLVLAAMVFWWLRRITRDLTFRESRASVNVLLGHARSLIDAAERGPREK